MAFDKFAFPLTNISPNQLKSIRRDLLLKNKSLQESYQMEIKNRNRLSLHNEELQWKLKQNSEKFTTALMELSKSYQDHSSFLNECKSSLYGPILETSNDDEGGSGRTEMDGEDQLTPQSSPVMKGVVKKNESVSWVLEINDEESAEALANRIVKRTGSFRATACERSPSFKRQLSLGANALSQSASATSIVRQQSESPRQKSPRNRSNSLTVACDSKRVLRPPAEYLRLSEPLMASSPAVCRRLLSKSTSNGFPEEQGPSAGPPNGPSNNGLITCDASSLSSPRTELCPLLPMHQKRSKLQRIKDSAGEAMVRSIHSDDEASFGSGSEIESLSPVSSTNTSPYHSDGNKAPNNISIEEEAFMNKIAASLNGTPMEVSWSEDGENDMNDAHESSA